MGIYVNPGIDVLLADMRQEIYVDKSMIMTELNKVFGTSTLSRMCVSRPRRFGKTMVGNLISAYYTRGADSHVVFDRLELSKHDNWDEWLNKCNVIKIDLVGPVCRVGDNSKVVQYMTKNIVKEMRDEFPDVKISKSDSLHQAIVKVYQATGVPFVIIIDEYDYMIREQLPQEEIDSYVDFLRDLLLSADTREAIGLAYLTGILPILRKDGKSRLDFITDSTILNPGELATAIGFTHQEIKELCQQAGKSYDTCLEWYDGYPVAPGVTVCNSTSISRALEKYGEFEPIWLKSGSYQVITDYLRSDFKDADKDLVTIATGGSIQVDLTTFDNTFTNIDTSDKAFTYLTLIGYLVYDPDIRACRIPNLEIRYDWKYALSHNDATRQIYKDNYYIIDDTLNADGAEVAKIIDKVSPFARRSDVYTDLELRRAVRLAYIDEVTHCATLGPDGSVIAFSTTGRGSRRNKGIIIASSISQSPADIIAQMKAENYASTFSGEDIPVYLVAISYGKDSKKHTCKIEVIEKQ